MIEWLSSIGSNLSGAAIIGIWVFLFTGIRFHWHCAFCGKGQSTTLFKFLFRMCDHGGNFQL